MASGSDVWAVALTNDPVSKKAVSAALLGNDTVMLLVGTVVIAKSQRVARMRAR